LKDGFELDSTHLTNIHCNTNNTLPCLDALNALQGLNKVLQTDENI
jgi:glyceraldehyde-3-phosphate dehydrogenase/erythrose-4-phosphate dehydrogenase